jgi:N-formylglutamate amidohydrolase
MDFSKIHPDDSHAMMEQSTSATEETSQQRTDRDPLSACIDEFSPPFTIVEPAVQSLPVVFSSPHSGRKYPAALLEASALDAKTIRRSEDSFVDELFASAPSLGAPLICAEFPRVFCDVNRQAFELDPDMYSDRLPSYANSNTARVINGLGTIARLVAEGLEIYRHKLQWSHAKERIERLYHPYHNALDTLLHNTKDRFGFAILIDCHSMPSRLAADRQSASVCDADLVLGDRFGTSCTPFVVDYIEDALQRAGLSLVRNTPFAGGFCTEHYGRPINGIHAIQIEINRSLYMDERNLSRHAGLEILSEKLTRLIKLLADLDHASLITS